MGSKGKLWLNKILFNLICCIAGDNIAQTSQTDTIEYHEKLANEVIELEKNLNLRKQMNDHLLVHMKGNHN